MVGYDDGLKVDIVKAVFGEEQFLLARYHAGDISYGALNGLLNADRSGILEQTGAASQKGVIGLYSSCHYKKGAFQVGAARIVPARLHLTRIHEAELFEAESADGKVRVDFKDGILYAKADAPKSTERTAERFGLEYKIV